MTIAALAALVLIAWAWAFSRKATAARAKQQVCEEFAECFGALIPMHRIRDKEQKSREARRHAMRLMLIDPLVRDAFRAALSDAEEQWTSPRELTLEPARVRPTPVFAPEIRPRASASS